MIVLLLIILPIFLGAASFLFRGEVQQKIRKGILVGGASFHFMGTVSLHLPNIPRSFGPYFAVDPLSLLFLTLTSLLFLLASFYCLGYFHHERDLPKEGVSHLFVPCMLFFLSAMTFVTATPHLGLLWVAVEATTLASAPLIYYHHQRQALEAAWKYLLICSVGIAIALLGIFFVAAATRGTGSDLFLASLLAKARVFDPRWLKVGFILVLVGFGTKMGLAPMHNWLPDAHSEAPSPVSALLSGTLLNCAFLGILRFYEIGKAAGLDLFMDKLLIFFGIASLFVAAVFISGQKDYKRMLAYSSIEHMGILSLAVGVGAGFGGLLHAVNHSLTKALLFLTAGQILVAFKTKVASEVHGLLRTVPITGVLFIIGSLAILGSPPFSPFISEFLILREGLAHGHFLAMTLYLLFLGIIFAAMSRIVLGMVQGDRRELPAGGGSSPWTMIWPQALLAAAVLFLGLYLPAPMVNFLKEAVSRLGGAS